MSPGDTVGDTVDGALGTGASGRVTGLVLSPAPLPGKHPQGRQLGSPGGKELPQQSHLSGEGANTHQLPGRNFVMEEPRLLLECCSK